MVEHTEPAERPVAPSRVSYAQNMEDILLDRLFQGHRGTFLDIGANHPYIDSNTYFFYLRGWRGVNIEPNPRAIAAFQTYRPEDRNLALAVSDNEGSLPFFEVVTADGSTGLSTLDRSVAASYRDDAGVEINESSVPARTVASLIEEHRIEPPDLVSIDVESHEAAVIHGIPLETWRPKVFVIESTQPLSGAQSHEAWESRLLEHGYLFAAFNGVNRFYLRGDMAEALRHFATPVSALDHYLRHDLVAMRNEVNAFRDRYERAQADRAFDQARHEELRQAWAWGQVQATHAQAVWEKECASFARERETWKAALDHFERSQAEFERRSAEFAQRQAAWDLERAAFERDRVAWAEAHAATEAQLVEAQRSLRPYRVLDRLGLVSSGYGWARRLKQRMAM